MGFLDGTGRFDVRRAGELPRSVPYEKASGDTTPIKKGHPVVISSGNIIRRAAVTAGRISDAKLLGFAVADDAVLAAELPAHFPRLPTIKRPDGNQEIKVYPADREHIFTAAVASGQAPVKAHVGQIFNMSYNSTNDQFLIDVGSGGDANVFAVIENVVPGDEGVIGGRLDFTVRASDSQWDTGL